jgi:hypothetical protein
MVFLSIRRYGGLGEMIPEQLWAAMINPEARIWTFDPGFQWVVDLSDVYKHPKTAGVLGTTRGLID